MMSILVIFAMMVFTVYITATICEFGIPISISNTYYLWRSANSSGNNRNELLFTGTMVLSALTLLPAWIMVSTPYTTFLPFLSVSGMMFVGGAAAYKETLTDTTHYVSAGIWAVSALIWIIVSKEYAALWIPTLIVVPSFLINKCKNKTFWLEMYVVIAMFIAIINKYFNFI